VLVLACFSSVFGVVFLGEARLKLSRNVVEPSFGILFPQILLSVLCIVFGLSAFLWIGILRHVLMEFGCLDRIILKASFLEMIFALSAIPVVSLVLFIFLALVFFLRRTCSSKSSIVPTWDCGYAKPTSNMQYSASSVVRPLIEFFAFFLRLKFLKANSKHLFPTKTSFSFSYSDVFEEKFYMPLLGRLTQISKILIKADNLGGIHLYILYMTITLIVLLFWTFFHG
jgi:hypothetical protein